MGVEAVGKFIIGIWKQFALNDIAIEVSPQWFNGAPGVLIRENGTLATAITLDMGTDGIQSIYAIRNPDKLAGIALHTSSFVEEETVD